MNRFTLDGRHRWSGTEGDAVSSTTLEINEMLDSGGHLMTGDQLTPLLARLHDADDRIAMGLPQQVVDRLPVDSRDCVGDLVGKSPGVLADIVECGSESVSRRFFSGQLLALLGDPRIKPDMPAMVDIPSATVHVGLDPQSVDSVLHRRAPHGLQRDWLLKECPRYEVHVKAFRIMRYPVTNCEYHRFLAGNGVLDVADVMAIRPLPT